ncbi:MAG: restriction endonuclease [Candidatus Poribacteria bacterium]|nr:restriction endonuclease [Candidatus Poribacteria bacterium]
MAKIRGRIPKESSGGYARIFGNEALGELMSKVHGTSISAGSELERLVTERVETIDDLDAFLRKDIMPDGVLLAKKKEIKKCIELNAQGSEPDFIIFKRREGHQRCHIVELKDGHIFDTKKADSEREALHNFAKRNAGRLPYRVSTHFCAFNQDDPEVIWRGFKQRIDIKEAMTGREFCDLLEIDYDKIVEIRKPDAEDNIRYFLEELLRIPETKSLIEDILSSEAHLAEEQIVFKID